VVYTKLNLNGNTAKYIDLNNLSSGMYISITSENTKISMSKIVIQYQPQLLNYETTKSTYNKYILTMLLPLFMGIELKHKSVFLMM
jgi:hypothetical protein